MSINDVTVYTYGRRQSILRGAIIESLAHLKIAGRHRSFRYGRTCRRVNTRVYTGDAHEVLVAYSNFKSTFEQMPRCVVTPASTCGYRTARQRYCSGERRSELIATTGAYSFEPMRKVLNTFAAVSLISLHHFLLERRRPNILHAWWR